MAVPADAVCAIGRLAPNGPWVGLRRSASGWALVFGAEDGPIREALPRAGASGRVLLIAAASAYFSELLADPPPELEATQADLAGLVGWLAATEPSAAVAARAREALDAIDDGLATDAVITLLNAYAERLTEKEEEQADPVDLLLGAYRALAAI